MTTERPEYFTVVFEGRLHAIDNNPFKIQNAFGKVVAAGMGDALSRQETVEELLTVAIKSRELADHCAEAGVEDFEIDGCKESVGDFSAELSSAINRATGAQ